MTESSKKLSPSTPSWWKKTEGEFFDIFESYQKIGSCSYAVVTDQTFPRKTGDFFPKSWFLYKNLDTMLPVLEIIELETINKKNKGYGRECLKALFKLSQQKGCHGRLQVFTTCGTGPFYEHCGFKGFEKEKDGFKYFDPTPENLKLLFSKNELETDFKFIPVITHKSEHKKESKKDPVLLKQMLEKANKR